MRQIIVGINAWNITSGGGLTHLAEVLRAARPDEAGVEHVHIWASETVLQNLPQREWITAHQALEWKSGLVRRVLNQRQKISAEIRGQACDVVLLPGGAGATGGLPFVTVSQNLLPFSPIERARYSWGTMRLRLIALEWVQKRALLRAAGRIFLTQTAMELIQKRLRCSFANSWVIPHGISSAFRKTRGPVRPMAAYDESGPFNWLYVSRIDAYKHQPAVIAAAARLRAKGFPVRLTLIGPSYPPSLPALMRTINQYDPERHWICYKQSVEFSQLPKEYGDADAFIFASTCECMPNILLEAMASGLAIVSSDWGPMPEILGESGLYCKPPNIDSISNAMREMMINDEFRESCGRKAHARSGLYSWESAAQKTFEAMSEVVARRHSSIYAAT